LPLRARGRPVRFPCQLWLSYRYAPWCSPHRQCTFYSTGIRPHIRAQPMYHAFWLSLLRFFCLLCAAIALLHHPHGVTPPSASQSTFQKSFSNHHGGRLAAASALQSLHIYHPRAHSISPWTIPVLPTPVHRCRPRMACQ
jgi:hypothetical protein